MAKKQPKFIYTSPDGGHTVYQQEFGKDEKIKISEDDYALSVLKAQDEEHMCGWEAVQIRKKQSWGVWGAGWAP